MAVPNVYIDDNGTIYATNYASRTTVPTSNEHRVSIGLDDISSLSGQSTWFINKVYCRVTGYTDTSDPATSTGVRCIVGSIPLDLLAVESFARYGDFQDFKAFPLKGSLKHTLVQNTVQKNEYSYSFTWSPRDALIQNRGQTMLMTVSNLSAGAPLICTMFMYIQAKRAG